VNSVTSATWSQEVQEQQDQLPVERLLEAGKNAYASQSLASQKEERI
jgi:hypothetical protein